MTTPSLESLLGFERSKVPLAVGTVNFSGATVFKKEGSEFDSGRPRILVTGGRGDSYKFWDVGIYVDVERNEAFNLGRRLSELGAYVLTGFGSPNSIPHAAALGAAEAAKNGGLVPIAVNSTNFLGIDKNRAEPYGLILNLAINSGIKELNDVLRNLILVKAAHAPVAFGGMIDTHDLLATFLELHSGEAPGFFSNAGGITEYWIQHIMPNFSLGKEAILAASGAELADLVYQRSLQSSSRINGSVPFINNSLQGLSSNSTVIEHDFENAERLGFKSSLLPLSIGTVIFSEASVSYRGCFELDLNQKRIFVAGGAGDYYDFGEQGISLEDEMEMAYKFGRKTAQLGGRIITGYTPKRSIPHAAAIGAFDAGIPAIGINPAAVIGDDPERAKYYDVIINLSINSGNAFVDFILRNVGNYIFPHGIQIFSGMHGTNDEGASWLELHPDQLPGIYGAASGITQHWPAMFTLLSRGRKALVSNNICELAQAVYDNAQISPRNDQLSSFLVNGLIEAGIPVKV